MKEVLTDRAWNLLFIGVSQDQQGRGLGSQLLKHPETRPKERSQRMLVIETTNGPESDATRAFNPRHHYSEEGTIRDFYTAGAHKITFRKLL